jgi:phage shock protein PspC (stress-responsive transcriptional regulator)
VCAAIGRATNTDPVLWRVLLAVLGLFGGIGILLYLALWLITPAEDDSASPLEGLLGRGRSSTSPVVVIILGMLLALVFGLIVTDAFRAALLGAAVVIGGALLLNRHADGRGQPGPLVPNPAGFGAPPNASYATPPRPAAGHPAAGGGYGATSGYAASGPASAGGYPAEPEAPPTLWTSTAAPSGPYPPTGPYPPPAFGSGPQGAPAHPAAAYAANRPASPAHPPYPADSRSGPAPEAPYAQSYPPPYATASPVAVPTSARTGGYRPPFAPHGPYAGGGQPPAFPPAPPVPPPPKPPKERSGLGAATFSMVFVALGAVAVLDLSNAADVGPSAYFAGALGVVALGLLIGAWFGRARWLIALGLVLAVALGIATAAESWNRVGNVGSDVVWRHNTVGELANRYENNFGNSVLDISGVDFTGQDRRVTVGANFGSLEVMLPPEVDVTVTATLGAGKATVLGDQWSGVDRPDRTVTDLGPDGAGGGELELIIEVNAGDLEVHR